MTHLVKRKKFGVTADCNDCGWRNDDGKDPMGAARRHTTRTGHLTFVTIEYTYRRRAASAGEAGTATDSEAGVAEGEHAAPEGGDAQ
jgi:hypothetical protein